MNLGTVSRQQVRRYAPDFISLTTDEGASPCNPDWFNSHITGEHEDGTRKVYCPQVLWRIDLHDP